MILQQVIKKSRITTLENKTKILVLGGAGHVGSNLINELLKNPTFEEVYSLDDYSNGTTNNHKKGCKYITGNVADIKNIISFKVDTVVHLAEFARIEQSFDRFSHVVENNIIGTLKVIEFCITYNCKLIYSASSAISSMSEPDMINAPYTITKHANVEILKSIAYWKQLNHAIVYFYNVYGPGEKGHGPNATVVEKFITQKILDEDVTITAPGTQRRNFTHVYDIVNGLIKVIKKGFGDGYYIGNPTSFSIVELAELMQLNYNIGPPKMGNRSISQLDIHKMNQLGWEPKEKLEDYIFARLADKI